MLRILFEPDSPEAEVKKKTLDVSNGQKSSKPPLAQMDRALPSGGRGRRFDSCRVGHLSFNIKSLTDFKILNLSSANIKVHHYNSRKHKTL